jgi:hypothetical protein
VALSLNQEAVNLSGNAAMRLLARQTFMTFLYIIGIALTFLIPGQTRIGLGLSLVLIAILGLIITLAELRGVRINSTQAVYHTLFRRSRLKIVAFALMIVIGFLIMFGNETSSLYWMVTPMLFLLFSASLNTWSLLIEVRDSSSKK